MNMMALTWGETTIVVDAGVMFPDPDLLGVDRIIPDLTYLQQKGPCRRARPDARPRRSHRRRAARRAAARAARGPIYGDAADAGDGRAEAARARARAISSSCVAVRPRDRVTIGPFTIEFIRVTHSMPDCVALAIHTPVGVIVHTGDFKIDQTPIDGEHFDVHRFAQLGADGVLALFADSTNVDRRGFTGSETEVVEAFEEIFTSANGPPDRRRVLVEHLPDADPRGSGGAVRSQGRLRRPRHDRELADRPAARLSEDSGRRADSRLGSRRAIPRRTSCAWPPDRRASRCRRCRASRSTITATSSCRPDDTVVLSARSIPGNEKAIGRVINHIARRGADVIHEGIKHVHVSGHGSEEELKLMLSLVRPRYFVPVHGEYRQLAQHARVAGRVFAGRDAEAGDSARRERRRPPLRRQRARGSPARRRSGAC